VSDPLLCLTVSITLRDKPFNPAQLKHPLAAYLNSMDALSRIVDPVASTVTNGSRLDGDGENDYLNGLEEVNLFEGLAGGTYITPFRMTIFTSPQVPPSLPPDPIEFTCLPPASAALPVVDYSLFSPSRQSRPQFLHLLQ
jgi:hypothetical protein